MINTGIKIKIIVLLVLICKTAFSQDYTVVQTQNLDFGVFAVKQGGSITISNQNVRTSTGDVLLLGSDYNCAAFNVTSTSTIPVMIQIDRPSADLIGSNGSSVILDCGLAQPQYPVVSLGAPAVFYLGGTLVLGPESANPPGTYTGNILLNITIHNE